MRRLLDGRPAPIDGEDGAVDGQDQQIDGLLRHLAAGAFDERAQREGFITDYPERGQGSQGRGERWGWAGSYRGM